MTRRITMPVPTADMLETLAASRRLFGLRAAPARYRLLRDTFFDTSERTLHEAGLTLTLRMEARGRKLLRLSIRDAVTLQGVVAETLMECPVTGAGLYDTLCGRSELATRVRALVEPAALRPQIALDIDRGVRDLRRGPFGAPLHRVICDRIIAHTPGETCSSQEISVVEITPGKISLEGVAERLRADHALSHDGMDLHERILAAVHGARATARADTVRETRIVLFVIHEGSVALIEEDAALTLPTARGSGERMTAEFFREIFDASHPDLDLVGFAQPGRGSADIEVWLHEGPPGNPVGIGQVWVSLTELTERVGAPGLRDRGLRASLLVLTRSEAGARLLQDVPPAIGRPARLPVRELPAGAEPGSRAEDVLHVELSILDFNLRVLEMAEDSRVPLLERFRFLSIVSANLDEFFVVRVGRLKRGAVSGTGHAEGLTASDLLEIIAIRVRALMARRDRLLLRDLIPALEAEGVRIRAWNTLDPTEQKGLGQVFERDVFPLLTPRSISAAPGHPFPHLESLGRSLVAILRHPQEAKSHLGYLLIPEALPHFLAVPGSADLISTEDVVVAHADALFPGCTVKEVHTFRVSRSGDVEVDEAGGATLLSAVEDEVEKRPYQPVVRVEVQRTMPREVRAHLLRELRAERGTESGVLSRDDVYEVEGLIDLGGLSRIADLDRPGAHFVPFRADPVLDPGSTVFQRLGEGDVVVHHPYDDFRTTVGRFLEAAARDPDVVSIRITLYRTGSDSAVVRALIEAARSGKDVSVFVELKARFDEERNIAWTRRLTEAGVGVVYGLVGFKTHAKTTLVVRRESGTVRRYVHVGTGNYNEHTAAVYTDLGLLSADPDLGADLNDFFNELTGSTAPPVKSYRRLWVAPNRMARQLLRLIKRETEHARAGQRATIQAKLNGLADRRVVAALYRASRTGVDIDLIVRSICTLRPGVPGLSDRIRVRSILGRFLEHARIYHFGNAGQSEYFIGSADWRPRNLHRRVEVATPVDAPEACARLRAILDAELADPRAWVLRADGAWERLGGDGPTAQERFMAGHGRRRPHPDP